MNDTFKSPLDIKAETMYPPEPDAAPDPAPVDDMPDDTPLVDAEQPIDAAADDDATPEIAPEPDADEPSDGDTIEMESFEQLAEHLDTEPDFLQNLSITQKVNGKNVTFKIADALRTHRTVEAADTHLAEAKARANEIAEEGRAQRESIGETVAVFGQLLQGIESTIESEVKDIDWAALRQDDPAEYAAKKQDIEDRRAAVKGMREEATVKYHDAVAQAKKQDDDRLLESLPGEQKLLEERVPEWADKEKAAKEREEVIKYLEGEGFTTPQIQTASYNGRVLALAIKARRYDQAKGKSAIAKKKVITIPKVTKPGSTADDSAKPTADTADRASLLYG